MVAKPLKSIRALKPFLGRWTANGSGPMGPYTCERQLTPILEGKFVQMLVRWTVGTKRHEELCMFGVKDERLQFWSFTSDGKSSTGISVIADELPDGTLVFEAAMPAGQARVSYQPDGEQFRFVVESRGKKGWRRFLEQNFSRR
jgi:hypothetical protein